VKNIGVLPALFKYSSQIFCMRFVNFDEELRMKYKYSEWK